MTKEIEYGSEDWEILRSEEYQNYIDALSRLASHWVPRIRIQFAEKALEKFKDETIRRIVLEYGKESVKLEKYMVRDFMRVSEYGVTDYLKENIGCDCLNHASDYRQTAYMLFDIE